MLCLHLLFRNSTNFEAVIVQSPSPIQLFATPWTAARQASLSLTISRSLPKFMSIESVMPSNHLIFCSSSPPLLPSSILISLMFICIYQFSSVAQSCPTLCDPMNHSTSGFPVHHNSWNLLKLMSIKSVMPSNHLILCCLLLLPSIFPSIRVFSSESVLHIRWLKYWSFRFSISPSNEYSGLISFRMEWLDLLAVQGIVRSLLQHHSSKASILWGIQSQPAQSRPLGLGF